jgi:hypothetical protein
MRARRHLAETTRQPAGEVVGSHNDNQGGTKMEIETDGDCDSAFVTTPGP